MAEPDQLPGSILYRWAVLIAKFRCTPADIAGLTDAQIDELYFHARDKDGALIEPEPPPAAQGPPTRESRLATINQLEGMGLITAARANELREEANRRG